MAIPQPFPSPRPSASCRGWAGPAQLTDQQLVIRVMSPRARCALAAIDPDEWFPVATVARAARAEAARALALCAVCPVRAECLELSLRYWRTVGRYGIWGGLVEPERAAAYRAWRAGADMSALLGSDISLIDIAPAPVFARLERLDDRVPDGMGVSVTERRGIAAANVPAGQAEA
jgi:WhiB family transcriptional regulator, redox-sensing transcriptional regulator